MPEDTVRSTAIGDLLEIGFEPVGRWHLVRSELKLTLEKWGDSAPALYAFVIGDQVMYVGKTKRTLAHRLYGYLKGSGTQVTNIRVRANLMATLNRVPEVRILGFRGGVPQMVGRFRVSLPAGLEDSILDELNPPWNGGASRELERSSMVGVRLADARPGEQVPLEAGASAAPVEAVDEMRASFTLKIGSAYFHNGFFNVPRRFAHNFGGDGEGIVIQSPETSLDIIGKINRTANQNGSPRIMGGRELRTWMHRQVRLGSEVVVKVLGPKHVHILPLDALALPGMQDEAL